MPTRERIKSKKSAKSEVNGKTSKGPPVTPSSTSKKRISVVIALLAVITALAAKLFLYRDVQTRTRFADADDYTPKLVHEVKCSEDYKNDPFKECVPKSCGRVVRDDIVSVEEADHLLSVAKKGLSYGGSSGGASILDLHSGALSKQDKFINIYSVLSNEDAFKEDDFKIYRSVKNRIHQAISEHFNIPKSSLFLTKPTFFSRMNTSEAKTVHDEYWHPHIDRVTYGSFHYTSLLYLSTHGTDFTGGRFIFTDNGKEMTVEPRKARVSFFTSGSENVHYVEKLASGVRYAITISFTCDPTMAIADPDVR